MGSYLSKNAPMIKINGILVRSKAFREIKTYKDAIQIAGVFVQDNTEIIIIDKNMRMLVSANEKFTLVEGIWVEDTSIFIDKLYRS